MLVNNYPEYNIETLKVLLPNLQDRESREFFSSIPPEELNSFTCIIDWCNRSDLSKVQWYLDNHFPGISRFPSVLRGLPSSRTFGEDELLLLSPKEGTNPTYKQMMDEYDRELVLSIVSNVMQSEEYKLSFLREQVLIDASVPLECFTILNCAKTVKEFQLIYGRLVLEGKLASNLQKETVVKDHINVDLSEKITLRVPEEKVLVSLPAGLEGKNFKMLEL